MAVKINLTIITRNHAGDPEIGFLAKSISKSNGCATAMSKAWELSLRHVLTRESKGQLTITENFGSSFE